MTTVERKFFQLKRVYREGDSPILKWELQRGEKVQLRGYDGFHREERRIDLLIPEEGYMVKVMQNNGRTYEHDIRKGRIGFGRFRGADYVRAERRIAFFARRVLEKISPVDRW